MSTAADYELSFKLYDGNERNLDVFRRHFDQIREQQLQKGIDGSVNAKVISYFFEGMVELVDGDKFFWNRNFIESNLHYTQAKRYFSRFANSRGVRVRLDELASRMLNRAEGMILVTQSLQMQDFTKREPLFLDALEQFNQETSKASEMEENIPAIIAYSRALFAEAFLWYDRSKLQVDQDSFEAKKSLMTARNVIRQANFIDGRIQNYVNEIENKIDDLTKERILLKAEELGNQAIDESENGNFNEAKKFYEQATLFYRRASELVAESGTRRFLLSMKTVLEASILECEGNQSYRMDNDMAMSMQKFKDAAIQVEKAIALMGSFGNNDLKLSFTSQKHFYLAMSKLTEGIQKFDDEQYKEAMGIYEEAKEFFNQSIEDARNSYNEPLLELGERSMADLDGYIKMCETFIF